MPASFWICLSCSSVQICLYNIKLVQVAKYIPQICKLTHPYFIQKKLFYWRVTFSWKLFCLFLDKMWKNLSSWQSSYLRMEKMFMLRIHTFMQCFEKFGVQEPTSNSINTLHHIVSTFLKSVSSFFAAKCSRWIMQRVNNISCLTLLFIFGTTPRQ